MIKFIVKIIVNALAVVLIAKYIPGLKLEATYLQLAIIGAVLGAVNTIIR